MLPYWTVWFAYHINLPIQIVNQTLEDIAQISHTNDVLFKTERENLLRNRWAGILIHRETFELKGKEIPPCVAIVQKNFNAAVDVLKTAEKDCDPASSNIIALHTNTTQYLERRGKTMVDSFNECKTKGTINGKPCQMDWPSEAELYSKDVMEFEKKSKKDIDEVIAKSKGCFQKAAQNYIYQLFKSSLAVKKCVK